MIHYLNRKDLNSIFDIIYKNFTLKEKVPDYAEDKTAVDNLGGVLERIKMDDFYPDFYDKVTYLIIQINKGHFFQNGNKRLALVSVLSFIFLNGYDVSSQDKEIYRKKIQELFSNFKDFQDYEDFFPEEFAYYNLSVIIADSNEYTSSFEELKTRVKEFFVFSLVKKNRRFVFVRR